MRARVVCGVPVCGVAAVAAKHVFHALCIGFGVGLLLGTPYVVHSPPLCGAVRCEVTGQPVRNDTEAWANAMCAGGAAAYMRIPADSDVRVFDASVCVPGASGLFELLESPASIDTGRIHVHALAPGAGRPYESGGWPLPFGAGLMILTLGIVFGWIAVLNDCAKEDEYDAALETLGLRDSPVAGARVVLPLVITAAVLFAMPFGIAAPADMLRGTRTTGPQTCGVGACQVAHCAVLPEPPVPGPRGTAFYRAACGALPNATVRATRMLATGDAVVASLCEFGADEPQPAPPELPWPSPWVLIELPGGTPLDSQGIPQACIDETPRSVWLWVLVAPAAALALVAALACVCTGRCGPQAAADVGAYCGWVHTCAGTQTQVVSAAAARRAAAHRARLRAAVVLQPATDGTWTGDLYWTVTVTGPQGSASFNGAEDVGAITGEVVPYAAQWAQQAAVDSNVGGDDDDGEKLPLVVAGGFPAEHV